MSQITTFLSKHQRKLLFIVLISFWVLLINCIKNTTPTQSWSKLRVLPAYESLQIEQVYRTEDRDIFFIRTLQGDLFFDSSKKTVIFGPIYDRKGIEIVPIESELVVEFQYHEEPEPELQEA